MKMKKPPVTVVLIGSRATLGGTPKNVSPSSLIFIDQSVLRTFLKCKHSQIFLQSLLSSLSQIGVSYFLEGVDQSIMFSMYRCCSPIFWIPKLRLATASYDYFTSNKSEMQVPNYLEIL